MTDANATATAAPPLAPTAPVTEAAPAPLAPAAPTATPKKRGRKASAKKEGSGKRGNPGGVRRAPGGFKDWLRLINSQGNALPNQRIKVVVNTKTKVVSVITQAFEKEGSATLEPERTQVFRFTEFETTDVEPPPPAAEPAPAPAAEAAPAPAS